MSHSRYCCVRTVGPVEGFHLTTTLVIIRYSTLSRRLSLMIRVNSELKCDVSEIVSVSIIRQWLLRAKDNDNLWGTRFITGISANFIIFTTFLSNFIFWFWNKILSALMGYVDCMFTIRCGSEQIRNMAIVWFWTRPLHMVFILNLILFQGDRPSNRAASLVFELSGLLSQPLPWLLRQVTLYTYIRIRIYTHIYIYIYVCVCVCVWMWHSWRAVSYWNVVCSNSDSHDRRYWK